MAPTHLKDLHNILSQKPNKSKEDNQLIVVLEKYNQLTIHVGNNIQTFINNPNSIDSRHLLGFILIEPDDEPDDEPDETSADSFIDIDRDK